MSVEPDLTLPYGDQTTWTAPFDVVALANRVAACHSTIGSAKGKVLEELITWLLPQVPGFSATQANIFSAGRASEVDVILWNDRHPNGFPSFPDTILVECKNWEDPVDSSHVAWFDWKLRLGGAPLGILVATKGITGNPERRSKSWSIVQSANMDGRKILIVCLDDLTSLTSRGDLRNLLIDKLSLLAGCAPQLS